MEFLDVSRRRLSALLLCGLVLSMLSVMSVSAESVHKYYYKAKVLQTVTLRSTDKKEKKTFRKNTSVTVTGKKAGKQGYKIISGEKKYMISASKLRVNGLVTDGDHPYDQKTAEDFVNRQGYASSTKYLIWVSSYKQHMYIFKGAKKNWKLVKHYKTSTGKFGRESKFGRSILGGKRKTLIITYYYRAYYARSIRGGYIHSWTYNQHGKRYSGNTGTPRSSGCVRLEKPDAKWLYDNVPAGTTYWLY